MEEDFLHIRRLLLTFLNLKAKIEAVMLQKAIRLENQDKVPASPKSFSWKPLSSASIESLLRMSFIVPKAQTVPQDMSQLTTGT